MSEPAAARTDYAPPPVMPSILLSAVLETRTVLALTRRTLALVLARS